MGSGKTTLGRILARRLERDFVDTDHEIEARTGVGIPTIFEIEGEEGFRKREASIIRELSGRQSLVVATGGGAVLREENRDNLRASGFVVYLDVPPLVLWERTRNDRNRPLLKVNDPLRRLQELYAQRDGFYRQVADVVVDGNRNNVHHILHLLLREVGE